MSEKREMNLSQVELSKQGYRLFRNNTGVGFQANDREWIKETKTVTVHSGDVVLRRARRINFGLFIGSGDLIGFKPTLITADMVGQTLAVFATVEQKVKGRKRTKEQVEWDAGISSQGGISLLLREQSVTSDV